MMRRVRIKGGEFEVEEFPKITMDGTCYNEYWLYIPPKTGANKGIYISASILAALFETAELGEVSE